MPHRVLANANPRKSPADVPLLELRGIRKTFPGVRALDRVDFTLRRGEIHALLGENGAGKSTLIKVLTGVHRSDEGGIWLAGRPIAPRSPAHAQRLGISTVYQEVNLIPCLSVAENIFLGRQPTRWGCIDWPRIRRRAAESLERLGLPIDVTQPLASYSVAIQQMVAVARALDIEAQVLIFDEPTSSLDPREVEQLFSVFRQLKARGLGIIFITHFLEQVYAVADRMTVLRNGALLGEYEPVALSRLELIAKMLGRAVSAVQALPRHATDNAAREPFLRARGLGRRGALAPLDLEIRRGEVLGLAGLLGSGRTETARLLFGIDRPDTGRMEIEGRLARLASPRQAIARGLGFCPEDRQSDGLIPELSVRENIVLALQARRGWLRPLGRRGQTTLAEQYIAALCIATPDAERRVALLSGGNQQKVLLARWLALRPKLLILDEPTRGIDVGAKAEMERLIADVARAGMAVLLISSELEELVRGCHRVAVLRDRRKIGELSGERMDVAAIMKLIAARV